MKKYALLLSALLLTFLSALSYAQAPVPFINLPLVPDATPPGGPQFTLTVNGTGFVSNSVVNWNGVPLATQFVSGSQLTAAVPAVNIATANTGWLTVVTPPPGGGTSNTAFFTATADVGDSLAFTQVSSPATGDFPIAIAVGDFNGDGKLDLAVANWPDSTLTILMGDGTGNFTLASTPAAGQNPYAIAVGDFNNDGKLDLVVADNDAGPPAVSVLLGDGTGNFTLASSPVTTSYSPRSVAVGDFNGDGNLDLAVACSGSVSVLLGDGTGNFTLASSPTTGGQPSSVAVGDFNGDGKLDLAVANFISNTVSILLGDGTGNFTPVYSLATGNNPWSVAVGDFNGDGKLDLAVANGQFSYGTPSTVSVFLGNGKGNFKLASSPAAGDNSQSVVVGDFNGDNKLDLAVTNWGSSNVFVLLGNGTGNFIQGAAPATDVEPYSGVVGDFNGDGKLDLAVTNFFGNSVSILAQVPLVLGVELFPQSLSFGTQLLGTSSNPEGVTLTNTGNGLLNIKKIAASTNFTQTNNCSSSLAAGAYCVINVVFTPHSRGTATGTVIITDNAPNSPQTVSLKGVGTAVTLLPASLNFGNQAVGTTSPPQTATLTNYGNQSVSINGVGFVGGGRASFAETNTCGTSLPAGDSCTVSITFKPKSEGSKTATFEVEDNGGASPQTVTLTGAGTQYLPMP